MRPEQRTTTEAFAASVGDIFTDAANKCLDARAAELVACDLLDPDHAAYLPDDGFVGVPATRALPKDAPEPKRDGAAVLTEDFLYVHGTRKRRRAVVTPRGYVTDFTSTPPAFRWLISQRGAHERAAVVHDWLYTIGPRTREARREADVVFRDALEALKTPKWKCAVMYRAVRWFGGGSFARRDEWRFRNPDTFALIDVDDAKKTAYRRKGDCRRDKPR